MERYVPNSLVTVQSKAKMIKTAAADKPNGIKGAIGRRGG
jgi:hypothetical protein